MPEHRYGGDTLESFVGPRWVDHVARWIKKHVRGLLIAGILFQLIVLSSMIVIHSAPLMFGKRILLHVRPVDPRDLFRGDFLVLRYEFSRVPVAGIVGLADPPQWRRDFGNSDSWLEDRTVYAPLVPEAGGQYYKATEITTNRPASGLFLKGRFSRSHFGDDLKFGIEAFYVEEGQGSDLEKLRNASQLTAEVAVAPWGQATLCSLK